MFRSTCHVDVLGGDIEGAGRVGADEPIQDDLCRRVHPHLQGGTLSVSTAPQRNYPE